MINLAQHYFTNYIFVKFVKLKYKDWRLPLMNYAIGIDIGGTKIAIGLVDSQGSITAQTTLPNDL